jgi:hypothetical protein
MCASCSVLEDADAQAQPLPFCCHEPMNVVD